MAGMSFNPDVQQTGSVMDGGAPSWVGKVILWCKAMKRDANGDVTWNISPTTKTMATQAT